MLDFKDQNKQGLNIVSDSTFTAGGLGKHSVDDLERLFAGKAVDLAFNISSDAFEINGYTTPEDVEDLLKLICAYMTDPGYRKEAITEFNKTIDPMYNFLRNTPQGVIEDQVAKFLTNEDFRFGVPEKEVMLSRTLDEVKFWLSEPLRNGYTELSIVGDVDKGKIVELVSKTIGALSPRNNNKQTFDKERALGFPQLGVSRKFDVETRIPKTIVQTVWKTDDIWDMNRTRKLSLLAKILENRVLFKVREEFGDTYSPRVFSSSSETFKNRGFIATLLVVDPDRAEKIKQLINDIVADLLQNGISDDEFTRAINPLMTNLKELMKDNGYWLGAMESIQEYHQQIEWIRTLFPMYENMKKEDVYNVAKQYLSKPNISIMVVPSNPENTSSIPVS